MNEKNTSHLHQFFVASLRLTILMYSFSLNRMCCEPICQALFKKKKSLSKPFKYCEQWCKKKKKSPSLCLDTAYLLKSKWFLVGTAILCYQKYLSIELSSNNGHRVSSRWCFEDSKDQRVKWRTRSHDINLPSIFSYWNHMRLPLFSLIVGCMQMGMTDPILRYSLGRCTN